MKIFKFDITDNMIAQPIRTYDIIPTFNAIWSSIGL